MAQANIIPRSRRIHHLLRKIPARKILGRGLLLLATMVYFAFALTIIVLRYWVLPDIESYRPDLEQAASFGLGRRVTIASVEADWRGLNPYLALHEVAVYDEDNRPALKLGLVESTLSWSSLWHLGVRQQSLVLWRPSVIVRRDKGGQIFAAGIPLSRSGGSDGKAADWLLGQEEIAVRDADMIWIDEQRAAPPLDLAHVEFQLDNNGSRHRFALRAQPPREHASLLDLRGDLYGDSAADFSAWRGQLFASLPYADLTAWRAWVDYPLELNQGRGGLRLWAEFKGAELQALTADVGLADVVARLGRELPLLELQHLQGRFQFTRTEAGYTVAGSGATLRTSAGVAMEQADFLLRVARGPANEGGEIHANNVDLKGVAQLTEFLPLDPALLNALIKYAPQGKVYGLTWNWSGSADKPVKYALQSGFTGLGLNAGETTPGFAGLSGSVKADATGGTLTLDAQNVSLDLPAVFEDPHLIFDTLAGHLSWRLPATGLELNIADLAFANADAAGSASGSFKTVAGGPGIIDASARLTRADARAAARYMPKKLERTRDWLTRSILAGTSQDVRLKLKGDLAHYPFPDDKDGVFQITAQVAGGTLQYNEAWPAIDNIAAELNFHGRRMDIIAGDATILGTRVSRTKVEIPDMQTKDKTLLVAGTAEGPTSEFLRFIELSPVSAIIDDFTRDMRATGNGKLTLKLALPLPSGKPKINGSFQFVSDQFFAEPSLPPLNQLSGRLDFTESGVSARNITANFLGGPTAINASTRGEPGANTITVTAQGTANMQNLERALEYPWLKRLSGNALWRASISVRKHVVDVIFDSTLAGIGSELPDPLKKAAGEATPLRVERHIVPQEPAKDGSAQRSETWVLTLGKLVAARWVAQVGAGGSEIQRAGFALNEAAQLPARGMVISGSLPVFDVDQWRDLLPAGGEGGNREVRVNLKLGALDALGRRFNDVDFHSNFTDATWHSTIKSREMEGDIDWQPKGQGKVVGRLKQFALPDASPHARELAQQPRTTAATDTASKDLPELDLTADNFIVRDKSLGKLKVVATNVGRDWNIDELVLANADGSLNAKGVWQNYSAAPHTNLNLHLDASDVGKLLGRLGFPGTMQRGQATLDGDLAWNGSPQSIDYPSLSGKFTVVATKGQFSKIEPGIGKLLGILSLQALPRRLSLDFKDVFSDGFAFDEITGKVAVARGVMATDDLKIDGPAAKVRISGSANLVSETQKLRVTVTPSIGNSVGLLGGLINPVVGIGIFLGGTVLQDPISKMFFERDYSVTGSWADPKVEKIGRGPAQPEAAANPAAVAAPAAGPASAGLPAAPAQQQGAKP